MTHTAPHPDDTDRLSDTSRAVVRAAFDDGAWSRALDDLGPVAVASILKRVLADIGDQEQHRMHGLSEARDNVMLSDDEYQAVKRNYHLWKRSIAEVRQRVRLRLAEVQPFAQKLIDEHQADRRTLVVLAKRIWLWEEGREDRLEEALDDFTISDTVGDPTQPRKTLRALVEEIARDGEVTP